MGTALNQATDQQTAQQSAVAQAENLRQQASGVNLDQEAVSLVQFQKAYDANSRFVTVIDTITSDLINMVATTPHNHGHIGEFMISSISPASQIFLAGVDQIQQRISQANQQITSGLKISVASDAPDQIGDLLQLRANEAQDTQIQSNLGLELDQRAERRQRSRLRDPVDG